jgi:hypothetical protein
MTIYNPLIEKKMFELIDKQRGTFTHEKSTQLMNVYFFHLKKV